LDHLDLKQDLRVHQDSRATRAKLEAQVTLVQQAVLDFKVHRGHRVQLGQQVHWARLVQLVCLGLRDQLDHKALKDLRVTRDLSVQQEVLEHQVHLAIKEIQDSQVQLVSQVQQVQVVH